jgi:prepilin-type N-terminal cleavage/methylation domain-containing protein
MFFSSKQHDAGFTLIDMVVVVALIGIISAISIPTMVNSMNAMRLGQSAREVEREIQMARQRAVSKVRPIRIRFNCPAVGQYRITELIGSTSAPAAADNSTNRCDPVAYPPAGDNNMFTRPNFDGPVKYLDREVSFGATQTIEFWPDGTAHYNAGTGNPWAMIPATGIDLTVTRAGKTSRITVNGLGKITLAQ